MTGIYLKCDGCGKTLEGEEVSDAPNGLSWSQAIVLRRCAAELGWKYISDKLGTDLDFCPACVVKGE